MDKNQEFLERLAKGISTLFGENCEITVHDLTHGYENTIVAIENGHVTGRHLGDGASEFLLRTLKDKSKPVEDNYSHLARTKDGRMVKSTSVFIKNDEGQPIGLFGINYDITDLIMAQRTMEKIAAVPKPESNDEISTISTTVNDLLDQLIQEADEYIGKPIAMMTKDDKTSAIQFLSNKGAFLIKKSGDKVSKHYGISKYTLYNYMDTEL